MSGVAASTTAPASTISDLLDERYDSVERGDIFSLERLDEVQLLLGKTTYRIAQDRKIAETGGMVHLTHQSSRNVRLETY